jgi:FtsP/CotA-like multicopper oxidase with cupredoxin domain
MRSKNMNTLLRQCLRGATVTLGSLLALSAMAAAPGIVGSSTLGTAGTSTFNLDAAATSITQPDGTVVYSWGYGCSGAPLGFKPDAIGGANCPTAQLPGPTLIVTEGDVVTVTLTNNLPAAVGNTSILFPGFQVVSSGGSPGLLAREAPNTTATCATAPCNTVTYTFTASTPGTHAYYSGTQGDLQIEMGLSGALIVLPKTQQTVGADGSHCTPLNQDPAKKFHGEGEFRLATSAYSHPASCYDREYLFQFTEMDGSIHLQAQQQVLADQAKPTGTGCTSPNGCLVVPTEPYTANYFMINGRSMPDDMDPNYASQYPSQPYNGNPHMHPGELTLLRIIGQGRFQHPFHEHANHVRVLARDGNLLVAQNDPKCSSITDPVAYTNCAAPAGPLMFTTTTTPGLAMDGIFYWTGRGLNWDVFGHGYAGDKTPCVPDANGYYTKDPTASNYYEWCGDHTKALEAHPFGQVASGGPATLPDPTIVTNGLWYGGSPYLGSEATVRAVGGTPLPVVGTSANIPTSEAGYAYMWHSHNEREITTNNIFPGGMMMMMLIDARSFVIDESN